MYVCVHVSSGAGYSATFEDKPAISPGPPEFSSFESLSLFFIQIVFCVQSFLHPVCIQIWFDTHGEWICVCVFKCWYTHRANVCVYVC